MHGPSAIAAPRALALGPKNVSDEDWSWNVEDGIGLRVGKRLRRLGFDLSYGGAKRS